MSPPSLPSPSLPSPASSSVPSGTSPLSQELVGYMRISDHSIIWSTGLYLSGTFLPSTLRVRLSSEVTVGQSRAIREIFGDGRALPDLRGICRVTVMRNERLDLKLTCCASLGAKLRAPECGLLVSGPMLGRLAVWIKRIETVRIERLYVYVD